jgi:hypothetical protein
MAIILSEWTEKYPDVPENTIIDWISDLTVAGVPLGEQEEEMKKKYEEYKEKGPEPPKQVTLPSLAEEIPAEEEPVDLREEIETETKKERHSTDEPDIPFDNPDMNDLDVPEDEYEDEDEVPEVIIDEPVREKPSFERPEMVTKTISIDDYEEILKPFKPFLEDIKKDTSTLNKLAAQIDGRYMPPYMQIKQYILNHPIKDPNNTEILLSVISEANPKATEQKYLPITQAVDVTRTLAEQAWFQASLNNYDTITEKMFEDRRALVSLIFILENYAEMKQQSPFELSIPKQVLSDSIETSFKTIKTLITDNVIKEMGVLRKDLQGEMLDVSQIVEKNMTQFDTQIQEAITKVLWKVKTDVESTNLEDIKKSLLYVLNKRSAAYNLGGGATAIITIMLDDLERRLMETGFKLENIKEHRKYTLQELTLKLGYKKATTLIRAIPRLIQRKLIKLYENKTISL